MTADLHVHRLVKKCGDALNRPTLVCTSGKEITKKRINLACHNFTEKIVTICSKPTCYDRYQEIHLLHGTQHRDCCYSSQRPMQLSHGMIGVACHRYCVELKSIGSKQIGSLHQCSLIVRGNHLCNSVVACYQLTSDVLTNFGRRSFAVSATLTWNWLPQDIRTFSRWSHSNPDSRLICSTTITDIDKRDTDTDAVFADSSHSCNVRRHVMARPK